VEARAGVVRGVVKVAVSGAGKAGMAAKEVELVAN